MSELLDSNPAGGMEVTAGYWHLQLQPINWKKFDFERVC